MAQQVENATVLFRLPYQKTVHCHHGEEVIFDAQKHPHGFLLQAFQHEEEGRIIPFPSKKWNIEALGKLSIEPMQGTAEWSPKSTEKTDYLQLVQKAIQAIRSQKLEKVVAAGNSLEQVKPGFSIKNYFEKLLSDKSLENAFVYLLVSPTFGTWVGASPELFFAEDNKNLKTVALAGTLPKNQKLKEGHFTAKEKEEQAWVLQFILAAFQKAGLTARVDELQKIAAGNLWHLKNTVRAEKKTDTDMAALLKALHPTPAVGGLPKEKALAFIHQNEKLLRSLYTGYLGPYEKGGNRQFFVNLRCMRYLPNESAVQLFAGAGIVANSMAEKEWEEIQNKMKTLRNHLSTFLVAGE